MSFAGRIILGLNRTLTALVSACANEGFFLRITCPTESQPEAVENSFSSRACSPPGKCAAGPMSPEGI